MKVTFKNNNMEEMINVHKILSRTYWAKQASKIIKRIDQLSACGTLKHMAFDRPHELKWDKKGVFAVDIDHPYRILFKPVWTFDSWNRATIVEIEIQELCKDYH